MFTSGHLAGDPISITSYQVEGENAVLPHASYHKTEHGWTVGRSGCLGAVQQQFEDALVSLKGAFAYSMNELTGYSGDHPPMVITDTEAPKPCRHKQRPMSPKEKEVMAEKVAPLLESGILVDSTSDTYASNSLLLAKKDADGNWTDFRLVHDYRPINKRCRLDPYKPPRIEDLFQSLSNARIFSKLDLRSGFLQLPLDAASTEMTSFWYQNRLLKYVRSPFGLKGSPAHFQRVMDYEIQKAGLSHCCQAYLDDVIC